MIDDEWLEPVFFLCPDLVIVAAGTFYNYDVFYICGYFRMNLGYQVACALRDPVLLYEKYFQITTKAVDLLNPLV